MGHNQPCIKKLPVYILTLDFFSSSEIIGSRGRFYLNDLIGFTQVLANFLRNNLNHHWFERHSKPWFVILARAIEKN